MARPGFIDRSLLKGEHEYVSVTRWASKEALDEWAASQAHAQAHGHGQGMRQPQAAQTGGHPAAAEGAGHASQPASSVLMYEVVIPESSK